MIAIRFCRLALLCASGALLAACTTDDTGQVSLLQPPMTHQRASAECWMQTEQTAQKMDLDKRVDLVNRCIDDKMKGGHA